jgi:hypothetical protein
MKRLFKAPENSELKISVYWGDVFYDSVVCKPKDTVTVGRNVNNTFILDLPNELSGDSYKLLELVSEDTADFFFDDYVSGHVRLDGKLLSLAAAKESSLVSKERPGVYKARLSRKDKADVVIGHVSFYLDWIDHEDHLILPRTPIVDKKQKFAYLALGLLALITIGVLQFVVPPVPEKPPERLVTLIPRNTPAKAAIGSAQTADGGSQTGALGKANLSNADQKPVSPSAELKKANLGSLVSGLTSLAKNAPVVNSGRNANAVSASIAQVGTGGFSTTGLKTGGGGKTVGIGRSVGSGKGGFEGTGRLGLSGDSALEGGTGHGTGEALERGGLDRDVIDAIIRRRQDRIRLCYERQLNFNPKLSGKVAVHFVIGKSGNVVSRRILEDTMKNASVNNCILNEVSTWTFPPPQGGTLVNVDYPFVFESSAKGAS